MEARTPIRSSAIVLARNGTAVVGLIPADGVEQEFPVVRPQVTRQLTSNNVVANSGIRCGSSGVETLTVHFYVSPKAGASIQVN